MTDHTDAQIRFLLAIFPSAVFKRINTPLGPCHQVLAHKDSSWPLAACPNKVFAVDEAVKRLGWTDR
jgi:hypothetical protein